jgi:tetratricopeptide (TPR) repeat protein
MTTNKKISRGLLAAAVAWLSFSPAAWAANPALSAYEQGVEDAARQSRALRIGELTLEVDSIGAIADFTLTARFDNPTDGWLEGRFDFELPDGAVVTGYALDVENTMIDGVLVEPAKAERAYEEKVRERIDPGLAKVSRANVFSTRVYPIPDNGSRTIRLRFTAPIHAERGLRFPLETAKPVGKFTLKSRGRSEGEPLALKVPGFTTAPGAAGASLKNVRIDGEVRIDPPTATARSFVSRHPIGRRFFQIVDSAGASSPAAQSRQRLRIYWDRSLSRADDALDSERALLAKYISEAQPSSIDLVVFNSSGARTRRVTAAELDSALRTVLYRGASSFAVLDRIEAPEADTCVMFSDGVVTIDSRRDFKPGCKVFAVTSANDADRGFLRRIAGSPEAVLRIGRQSETELLARLRGAAPRVLSARSSGGSSLPFAPLDGGAGWAVVGEAPEDGVVILRIAGIESTAVERKYTLSTARTAPFSGAGVLWASDRIALLAAQDDGHDALVALSRRFSVASSSLSFLVLEQPDDYVQAGIEPPASYPGDGIVAYRKAKSEFDKERSAKAAARLEEIIEAWDEQKAWWDTTFARKRQQVAKSENARSLAAAPMSAPSPAVDSIQAADIGQFPDAPVAEALQRVAGNEMLEAVMVTGLRASSGPEISVQLEEWNSERPYIKALDAAAPADLDRVLGREEARNGALPAFYFDVAEWLYRKGRKVEAVEMLLSALELPVANEETSAMVADRLQRYGRIDRAVWLYEKLAREADDLPQPRRLLALALAKRAESAAPVRARGDLERAVALLDHIVMTPWSDAYDGIELIALMDVNALLPKLRDLGVTKVPLDERLRTLLDVDLRVTLSWNTAATDMDLWVDEPTGERVIYSHPRSDIGGRLSNDMTAGFGPEEYLLRRAIPGEYIVSVNVYASDSINPNGTTVISARLIRDFGRATQKEETMEVELEPAESGEKLVGKFTVR